MEYHLCTQCGKQMDLVCVCGHITSGIIPENANDIQPMSPARFRQEAVLAAFKTLPKAGGPAVDLHILVAASIKAADALCEAMNAKGGAA